MYAVRPIELGVAVSTRTLLVVPGEDYGWHAILTCLDTNPCIGDYYVAQSLTDVRESLDSRGFDVLIGATYVKDESIMPVVSEIRVTESFRGPIHLFAQKLLPGEVVQFARLGVDGVLLWEDVSPDLLSSILTALVSCRFRMSSMLPSDEFLHLVRSQRMIGEHPAGITERQFELLKVWYHSDWQGCPPTRDQLANAIGVSSSTLHRELRSLLEQLETLDEFTLGVEVTRTGLLP